ncbi:hypothetical protein [Streptomyces macrosporus]|uniref:Uncharacterized protein n=1 Tax=Streptomyces macrosporus TaxID=44032 RepID=A0ABN3KKL8_9ACTN
MFDHQIHGLRAAELRREAERERLAREAVAARRRQRGKERDGRRQGEDRGRPAGAREGRTGRGPGRGSRTV